MSDTLHIPFAADTPENAYHVKYFCIQCKSCLRHSGWDEVRSSEPYAWFDLHRDHTGHTQFYRFVMSREVGRAYDKEPVTKTRIFQRSKARTPS